MASSGLVVTRVKDVTVVAFGNSAVLDSLTVDAVAKELYALVEEQNKKKILLDFTSVEFLSSQMLGVLLSLHKKAVANGTELVLCGLRKSLMKVFRVMSLHKLLVFAPDGEEALRKLSKI